MIALRGLVRRVDLPPGAGGSSATSQRGSVSPRSISPTSPRPGQKGPNHATAGGGGGDTTSSVKPDEVLSSSSAGKPTDTPAPKAPEKTLPGEWVWTGLWAFGAVPEPAEGKEDPALLPAGRRPKNLAAAGFGTLGGAQGSPAAIPRGFVYKFEGAVDPSTILVPSAKQPEENEDDQQNEENGETILGEQKGVDGKERSEDKSCAKPGDDKNVSSTDAETLTDKDKGTSNGATLAVEEGVKGEEKKGATGSAVDDKKQQGIGADSLSKNKGSDVTTKEKGASEQGDGIEKGTVNGGDSKKESDDLEMKEKNEKPTKSALPDDKPAREDAKKSDEDKAGESADGKKRGAKKKITFATVPQGQNFTHASSIMPKTCPVGGCWKGYFENVTKRKDRLSSRVPETFYLFFNSSPAPGARITFAAESGGVGGGEGATGVEEVASGEKSKEDKNLLPKGHVHVRGMGTNQFGTFEIVGGYDPTNGILRCQRMYIVIPEGDSSESAGRMSTRSGRASPSGGATTRDRPSKKRTSFGETPEAKRSYGTRKRGTSFSWQKRSFFGEDGDEEVYARGSKKRQRSVSEGGGSGSGATKGGTGGGQLPQQPSATAASAAPGGSAPPSLPSTTLAKKAASTGSATSSASVGSKAIIVPGAQKVSPHQPQLSPKGSTTASAITTTPKKSAASGGKVHPPSLVQGGNKGAVPHAAPSSSTKTSVPSSSPSSGQPNCVRLPPAGEPKEARWRSAHYLYYRTTITEVNPEETDGAVTPTSVSPKPTTPSTGKSASGLGSASTTSGGKGSNAAIDGTGDAAVPTTTTEVSIVVYEGEMNHGGSIREGRGACLYDGAKMIYEGEWKRNKEHGHGRLFRNTAEGRQIVYEGDWERGKMHGRGTYFYQSYDDASLLTGFDGGSNDLSKGGFYEGDFKENTRHGIGKYTLPDGSSYEGEWRDNVPSGRGVFHWLDGSIYDGQWKDGRRNGTGIIRCSDGFQFEGTWVDNAMEGRGVAVYPNGQKYEGSWANGRREGRGTLLFTNGAVYEGRFRDDLMEGQGTLKMTRTAAIPLAEDDNKSDSGDEANIDTDVKMEDVSSDGKSSKAGQKKEDWMIPIQFQSDMGHIHQKAGFSTSGE